MTKKDKTIVGKKGVILPKKPLRDLSSIQPGDEVIIEAYDGELIMKKIHSIDELLTMPKISIGTPERFKI